MLRYCKSSCTSAHTWCYATVRLLALPHIHDATLLHVFLHFLTYMMLRYFTSSCTSSHTWCYATVSLLALPHIHDATPLYVFLPCLTYMPCSMARFGRILALGSGDGKTVPTKTSPSSLQRLWRTLSAEKKESRWGFWHVQWKIRARFLRKFNYERDAKPLWFMGWNEWWTVLTLETRVW